MVFPRRFDGRGPIDTMPARSMKYRIQIFALLGLLVLLLGAAACGKAAAKLPPSPSCPSHPLAESGHRGEQWSHSPPMGISRTAAYRACIVTSMGNIVVELTPKTAPLAVNNFVFLALHRFYTNIKFHRVLKGFMIQTGDPTGSSTGGPGYSFPIEKSGTTYPVGTVAMANTGQPDTNGSQFFICQGLSMCRLEQQPGDGPRLHHLRPGHCRDAGGQCHRQGTDEAGIGRAALSTQEAGIHEISEDLRPEALPSRLLIALPDHAETVSRGES